jgi:hypothetical protein
VCERIGFSTLGFSRPAGEPKSRRGREMRIPAPIGPIKSADPDRRRWTSGDAVSVAAASTD